MGILDFTLFKKCERFYSRFHILEDDRHEKYTDKLEIHVLELPKLAKYEQPETELLKWAKFFQAEKKEEFEMASKDNEYLEKAYERLVNISADEKKRREYEARQDSLRDCNWQMKSNWRQGVREGMEQGMKQGVEQGMKQGMERGMELALQNLMETTGMALEEARKALKIPEEEASGIHDPSQSN